MYKKSFGSSLSVFTTGKLQSIGISWCLGLLLTLLPVNRVDAHGDRIHLHSNATELKAPLFRETIFPVFSYQQQSRSQKWLLATELVARMKVVGVTTPLPSTRRTWPSETKFSSLQVNSAIHFEIIEVLYGNYKVGDTVAFLQTGGRIDGVNSVRSTGDVISFNQFMNPVSQGEYLLFLIPFEKVRKMWKSEIRENDPISIIPDMPTEVKYPIFGSSWGRYVIRGDKLNAVGCLVTSEVSYPATLDEAKDFVKQIKLGKTKK